MLLLHATHHASCHTNKYRDIYVACVRDHTLFTNNSYYSRMSHITLVTNDSCHTHEYRDMLFYSSRTTATCYSILHERLMPHSWILRHACCMRQTSISLFNEWGMSHSWAPSMSDVALFTNDSLYYQMSLFTHFHGLSHFSHFTNDSFY